MAKLGSVSSGMLVMLLAVRTVSRFPDPRLNHLRTEGGKQKKKTKNKKQTQTLRHATDDLGLQVRMPRSHILTLVLHQIHQ